MKRVVKAPLLVTRCAGCLRRRACAFVPGAAAGWKTPLCRQCIRGLMPRLTAALRAFAEQGR